MASRYAGIAAVLCASGMCWAACSSSSPAPAAVKDASPDTTSDDSGAGEGFESGEACEPCIEKCSCQAGDAFFAAGSCTTYVCPSSGTWGPFACTGLGCPPEAGPDGTAKDGANDGAEDAAGDGSGDAPGDALPDAPATDASDAGADGPG